MAHQQTHVSKRWFEKFWVISLISFAIALGFLKLHYRWEDATDPDLHMFSLIAKEAGFACLVAFFLNLSVEGITRQRHTAHEKSLVALIDQKHQERIDELLTRLRGEHQTLQEQFGDDLEKNYKEQTEKLLIDLDKKYNETSTKLLQDVFQTVYERHIEPGVFKIIDSSVLRKDFMRKKYKASLTIRPLEGENPENLVALSFSDSYIVKNLTNKTITAPVISTLIDITPEYEDRCKFVSASVGGRVLDQRSLEDKVRKDEENALWKLVIAQQIGPLEEVEVSVQYDKVGPRNYSEVLCTTAQMDSLVMETFCYDQNLSVFGVSLHPEEATPYPHPQNPEYTSWTIDHAVLPGQGIVVFWHPKRRPKDLNPAEPLLIEAGVNAQNLLK